MFSKSILIFSVLITCAKRLYGYIDPGTGSYLIQILIAIIATGIYAIKYFWTSIKRFFQKIFKKKKTKPTPPHRGPAPPQQVPTAPMQAKKK